MSDPNASSISSRTILLVDDQDGNRIMTKWFLNHFGYTVESARSAEEALAMFDPRVHDLVVTDNSMPGMTGAEKERLVVMIRRIRAAEVTVLVVEHDMRLVMGISETVIVLNHGRVIATGAPASIQAHPDVIRAYLGSSGAPA